MSNLPTEKPKTILIAGASRGLGQAMAAAFVGKGWHVIGTVRDGGRTDLHALADAWPDQITIAPLDITDPAQIGALRERLPSGALDILFVNAGTANRDAAVPAARVAPEDFMQVMLTNALGVMRTVEGLQDLVKADGLIGVMSSGQGSIANNTRGGFEVYRASKAALNQLMRSYAARQAGDPRALVLMAPGWIRTGLGGPGAPFSMEETIPTLVDTLIAQQGRPGLRFIDRFGDTVPW